MLKDILARIDARLEAVGLKESKAAKLAGLSDSAIRDMRRALKAGKEDAGASSRTLVKLAPILDTTPAWLLDETGPEIWAIRSSDEILAVLRRIEGLEPDDVSAVLTVIEGFRRANAVSPPEPARLGGRSESATSRREASPSP